MNVVQYSDVYKSASPQTPAESFDAGIINPLHVLHRSSRGKGRGERGRWQSLQMFDFDGERRARGGMEEALASESRFVLSLHLGWHLWEHPWIPPHRQVYQSKAEGLIYI